MKHEFNYQPTGPRGSETRRPVGVEQGRPSTPGPARAITRVLIFGWKTNDGDEEATRVEALTPLDAGRAFADLLSSGHVHFTASRLDPDGRVAYL
jgi:hypothetical protein